MDKGTHSYYRCILRTVYLKLLRVPAHLKLLRVPGTSTMPAHLKWAPFNEHVVFNVLDWVLLSNSRWRSGRLWRIPLHKEVSPFSSVCSGWVTLFIFSREFSPGFSYSSWVFQVLIAGKSVWFWFCGCTVLVLISQILIVHFVYWRLICVSFYIAI